jgi:hypothetical protein
MKKAAVVEFVIAAGILLFWVLFLTFDFVSIKDPHLKEIYLGFESAFPFADICLAGVLIAGGTGLLKKASFGVLFSFLGGAALVFLGLLDFSFNTRHGIYLLGIGEAVMNLFINTVCLGAGLFLVQTIWKNRFQWKF